MRNVQRTACQRRRLPRLIGNKIFSQFCTTGAKKSAKLSLRTAWLSRISGAFWGTTATKKWGVTLQHGCGIFLVPRWLLALPVIVFAIIGHSAPPQHALECTAGRQGTAANMGVATSAASKMPVTSLANDFTLSPSSFCDLCRSVIYITRSDHRLIPLAKSNPLPQELPQFSDH